ncbi:MAG: acetate/propionate family kinase [Beijerinckiaceae bacterium]|nr:acetate/propionate family kinase [Beijerinckiaceae bacterium]MCI0599116.1 acetate/propionate family kinase [Beijerinckiaceae bacterium]
MTGNILVLNAGSSSIKFSLYAALDASLDEEPLCAGAIDGIGHEARFHAADTKGDVLIDSKLGATATHEAALSTLMQWLEQRFTARHLLAAGHRVVHGGARFTSPVMADEKLIRELRELIPLAPLHQPHNVAAIEAVVKLHPSLPQIICFDTAFHHAQPDIATRFALPRHLHDEGVRRYGFHGLSYEYIASVLPGYLGPEAARGRIVVAHLGAGASMCAIRDRKSIATTMGFTALDGLPMGKRCGTLDPGVVLYLIGEKKMALDAANHLLYNQSGLLGVSGISDDMRELLAADDPRAEEAIALFVYRIGRELGSLAAALGGLDALIFTAGIGEHAAEVRRRVLENAAWLGVELDAAANEAGGPCVTSSSSQVPAFVIPTNEDLMIARHSWNYVLRGGCKR